MKSFGFFVAGAVLTFSTGAYAADVKINTTVEVGAEYHFQLLSTDDGLRAEGTETKETDFVTRSAKVAVRGKLTDQLTWNALYQVDKNVVERYMLTNTFNDEVELSVGKQKIKTFGWHRRLSSSTSPIRSSILNSNPLGDALAVDLVYKMFGTWSLAAVKDYYDPASTCTSAARAGCKSWNGYDVQKQPALAFEWIGIIGDWQPLIQYSRYDRNHSSSLSAGLRFKSDLADAYVDYTIDERNDKGLDATGKAKDLKNKTQGIVVYGEFPTALWSPYAMYSTTNLQEFAAPGVAEVKTNKDGFLNDNERVIAAGVFYDGYGKMYRPYLGVGSSSGKYVDPDNLAAEENRSKLDIMLGVSGKF